MNPLRIFLLAALILVVFGASDVEAEKEPLWNYTIEGEVQGLMPYSVSISADGEYIAAGSSNDKLYLFDKDSSTPIWSYTTDNNVESVAISADGEYIAAGSGTPYSAGEDNDLFLFDKDSSTPLWGYAIAAGVRSVAISADGEYIAAGSGDNTVYLFHKDNNTPLWNYTTGSQYGLDVHSVAITADGEYIAAGSSDWKCYLFHKDSSTPLWNYATEGAVYSVTISADGEYIAASSSGDIYLFDKDSSTPLWNYTTGNSVYSVSISADGEYIAAGFGKVDEDNDLFLFDKDSNTPLWNYTIDGAVYSVTISADGTSIVACTYNQFAYDQFGRVYLFDKDSNTPLWNYTTEDFVPSVSISADGEYIITGPYDGKIYLFDKNIPPTATIDSITPSARFNAEVTFSGSGSDSDGIIVAYEWMISEQFEEIGIWLPSNITGFLSNEEDFSITGFSVGIHIISFRVQDNNGEWSEWDAFALEIYPNAPPVCVIDSLDSSAAEKGTIVLFNGSGSDVDGTIVNYRWTSSIDGEISPYGDVDESNDSFSVMASEDGQGTWTISIVKINPQVSVNSVHWYLLDVQGNTKTDGLVSDVYGYYSGQGKAVTFVDNDFNGKLSPGDKFEVHPSEAGSDLEGVSDVTDYSFRMKFEPNGDAIGYDIMLGNNIRIGTPQVSTFNLSVGLHTITFQVQDNDREWSLPVYTTVWVYVLPSALANDIGWNDEIPKNKVKPGDEVIFKGGGNDEDGEIVLYEWDFNGDGEFDWSSEEAGSTTFVYKNEGTYTAVLRVTDNDGFTATDSRVITVSDKEEEDESSLSSISLIPALISIGLLAIFCRK